MTILFTNLRLLDPDRDALLDGMEVLVEGERIAAVSARPIAAPGATRIDLGGRTLMPGLIDCHLHVVAASVDLWQNALAPTSLMAFRAARILKEVLHRGFTTVCDVGGADYGLVLALTEGLIEGPRLVICGKGLSMTGGHCDIRSRTDDRASIFSERLGSMGRLVDGVDAIRKAAREELKGGAAFIKIMANGGVASPNDPIHALQFSKDEIRAAVEEAENAGTYVSVHVYTDKAIRRAVECGVHSLEHCNLIRPDTARLAAEAGAVAVPTLVAYEGLALEGERFGLGPESVAKIETVRRAGLESLAIMRDAQLPMAFGSDLLGQLQKYHGMDFELLARVLTPAEIIRSATLIGAKLCHLEGQVGVVAAGAFADLLVVDGDPFADITALAQDGAAFRAIMKAGGLRQERAHVTFEAHLELFPAQRTEQMTDEWSQFITAVAAPDQPKTVFQALERLTKARVGTTLFTAMTHDVTGGLSKRIYSDNETAYPTGGSKTLSAGKWSDQVIRRQLPFAALRIEEIAEVFPDWPLIQSLGHGSCCNIPAIVGGEVIGTLNLLHNTGFYTEARVAQAMALQPFAAMAFLVAARPGKARQRAVEPNHG